MFRKHFNASTFMALVALVFAMTGGAFAVTGKGGGGSATIAAKKKSKPKVIKGPRGPEGKQGPAGPQGPAGSEGKAGKAGTNGSNGESVAIAAASGSECSGLGGSKFSNGAGSGTACNGKAGTPGTNGTNGKSVAVTTIAKGGTGCAGNGGAEVKQEGAASGVEVCNGAAGPEGNIKATLSTGVSEKGAIGVNGKAETMTALGAEFLAVPISFTIPLSGELASSKVHLIAVGGKGKGASEGCPTSGTAANPEAESGNLCIYLTFESNITLGSSIMLTAGAFGEGASPTGGVLLLSPTTPGTKVEAWGDWAVTG